MEKEKRNIYKHVVGFCSLKVFDWILRCVVVCLFILLVALAGEQEGEWVWWKYILYSLLDLGAMFLVGWFENQLDEVIVPAYKKFLGRKIRRYEKIYQTEL